jgi:hypothetical protein
MTETNFDRLTNAALEDAGAANYRQLTESFNHLIGCIAGWISEE